MPLTIVGYDAAEIGRQAARLLLDRLRPDSPDAVGPDEPPRRVIIPTHLVDYP
jgi:LacI family transcriptional regulator